MSDNCPVEIKPLSQSTDSRSSLTFNLNYTNQDFWSMKARLVDFVKERFGPNGTELPNTFNDFVESSIAIMLIENWAFLADTLSFKMDQIVNELFIDTVTEVENAFRLAKLVGFQPTPPIAARSKWIAQINAALSDDIEIETPISIDIPSTNTPTSIELFAADNSGQPLFDQNIIIPAGSKFNKSIVGVEGRTINEEFSGTGQVGQTLTLSFSPVIFGSIIVSVDGTTWEEVDYFTDSQPRKEYRIEFNSDYEAFVMFGNNRTGMIPSNGSRIEVRYRIGGGTIGNIVTGFIQTQRQVVVAGLDYSVPITYSNYTKGEYGYGGDGLNEVKRKLPRWIKTQDRAVTASDYKTLTDQFATPYYGKVGKSTAVLRNYGCSGNIVDLYILADDGDDTLANASNELKVALNEELNSKKMLTDFLCIKDGIVLNIDVSVDVILDRFYRKFETELKENILRRINAFFSINNWDYNQVLRDTDLIKELSDIKEIQSFQITFVTEDSESGMTVTPKFNEIIRPDTITISMVYN
ncbi:MAG: hypothetical protein DWQ19_12590 [Crenarchaeota archaeon]|nr:MAG: hypothetical protein DWQ19_12590 [Thermoproteota archaeon]